MRNELMEYFSNTHETVGLLVAEAPTGYGKTYETVQAIYQYVRNGGRSQILFVTNLLKNLPDIELKHAYEKDGRAADFEREVLVLPSTASAVEAAVLEEEIPAEFQTDAYHELRTACIKKQQYENQAGTAGAEMAKILEDRIRLDAEPKFRHELERTLHKTFQLGPEQRRAAIRSNKQYQWMAKFYPAVFWSEYKIILMSVQKLMVRNVPLVEHSFECLSDQMLKGRIVCIDEFDASRAAILNGLIDQALNLRADYLQLFLQVYRGTTTHKPSKKLERLRTEYEHGRMVTWADLLGQAEQIYQDGALYYSMKTVDADADQGRNFLFHDTSYHTVLDGKRTHIRAVRNDEQAQLQIHFETKAEYDAHRGEPRIVIQNLLRRIYVFLLRFQRYVYGWAGCYAKQVNISKKAGDDIYTTAAAVESILREYGLTTEQVRLMAGEPDNSGVSTLNHSPAAPNLSFYETGFRLFEFTDDDRHRTQTYLQYLQMERTPEKVLLYMCRRAKVVGLSATAALPTVLGNYDLRYLKEQLRDSYREFSDRVKNQIQQELETLWTPYKEHRIQIDLQIVDRNRGHWQLTERLEEIFSWKENVRKYSQRLAVLSDSKYVQKRYCNIFTAMKAFWAHSEIHSFLCLNQILPSPGKSTMDETLLREVLEALRMEIAPQDTGGITVLRSGDQFEGSKEIVMQALRKCEKCFILSSYQTLGAGQNLQYSVDDPSSFVQLKADANEADSRFRKKDMDALYLGDVTHTTVNLEDTGALTEKDLIKFCFQVECLYENDEISYQNLKALLKDGIGRFSGKRHEPNTTAQSALRQSASVHGQITRDVIQAVGRMSRTFLKRPVVYLFTTEKTLGDLDSDCLEGRLLSPEMQALYHARTELRQKAAEVDTDQNEAERKATRGKAYIMRMLNAAWTDESMALWKVLRQTVLRYPRAEAEIWQRDPVVRTYYIPLSKEKRGYLFAQKGDFSEVFLSLDGDRVLFAERLRDIGMLPSQVSEDEARLPLILSYPGMRDHFAYNGWATEFGNGPYILSPVLFQNIYKGVLGEAAGSFILQRELGLSLHEIDDPAQFEVFDFLSDDGIYFDFKHWKASTQVGETAMREKILEKINTVGGRRAFVINLISDGVSEPSCTSDGRLVEVPGLLLPDGQVNRSALTDIRRMLYD